MRPCYDGHVRRVYHVNTLVERLSDEDEYHLVKEGRVPNYNKYGELQCPSGKSKSSVIWPTRQASSTHPPPTTTHQDPRRCGLHPSSGNFIVGLILNAEDPLIPGVLPHQPLPLSSALPQTAISCQGPPPWLLKCLQPAFTWAIFPAMVRKSELSSFILCWDAWCWRSWCPRQSLLLLAYRRFHGTLGHATLWLHGTE